MTPKKNRNRTNTEQSSESTRQSISLKLLISMSCLPLAAFLIWMLVYANPILNDIHNTALSKKQLTRNFYEKINALDEIGENYPGGFARLSTEDLQKLKKTLSYLKEEVDSAIERSHFETTSIVDRVNLYVTLAVVLLTLFGIFVPLIIYNFGKDDLKEIKKDVDKKTESLNQKIEDETKKLTETVNIQTKRIKEGANEKLKEVEGRIETESERVENISSQVLNIPPLRLTISLSRALDKDLIKWYTKKPEDSKARLRAIFKGIKDDLSECKASINKKGNNILKRSLEDFNSHLSTLLFTVQVERTLLRRFDTLRSDISSFVENQAPNETISKFEKIIESVEPLVNLPG